MAERYGGKYSPGPAGDDPRPRPLARPRDPVGFAANLMFAPPVLLFFVSLFRGPVGLLFGIGGAALLGLGAWLLRGGLRAEAAFDARKVARRPALPRKILAATRTGLGVCAAVIAQSGGHLPGAALYGVAAGMLHLAAFGIDPLRSKTGEGGDAFQQARVSRAVDEGEAYLDAMGREILRANDRRLVARVGRFQAAARDLFRSVEDDPRDLSGVRRYMTVYLMGARDATARFADIYARSRDSQAREDYLALLDDLEQNFAARTRRMLNEDRSDLGIEIDVLRERLKREGVEPD